MYVLILLSLAFPISLAFYKALQFVDLKVKPLIKITSVFLIISILIIFSNYSFSGTVLDNCILCGTVTLVFLSGLFLKNQNKVFGKALVLIGKTSLTIPILLIIAFLLNPFYIFFSLNLGRVSPEATNTIGEYELEHYSVNVNFMGSTHLAVIKKEIIPGLLEKTLGKTTLGIYAACKLPDYYITKHIYEEGEWKPTLIKKQEYSLTEDSLFVKEYIDSLYITSSYKY
tara:strand:+ start:18 stop:701 length:684 start_codon:yes stop_codon:yes gene_type:complete